MSERGHLFVIDGDLTKIACDAWLLPTDDDFDITDAWADVLDDRVVRRSLGSGYYSQQLEDREWTTQDLGEVIYDGDIDGSSIYLANIGHQAADHQVYVRAALSFLKQASERYPTPNRRPRFALNHLGSGFGGARLVRGGVLESLIRAIEQVLDDGSVRADVILVAWGEKPEAASQYLRMQGIQGPVSTSVRWHFAVERERLHDHANRIAGHFRAQNSCVFMGAGTSAGAGLPGWSDLLDMIAGEIVPSARMDEYRSLGDQLKRASFLRDVRDARAFADAIKSHLDSPQYSLTHGLLASLPCTEYISTNVDELFEMACGSKRRAVTVLPSLRPYHLIDRWLLKIHGCVSQPDTLVFTEEDYESNLKDRRALFGVLQGMLLTRHMVFVGYSLSDPDFEAIVDEVRRALPAERDGERRKLGTVLTLFSESSNADQYSDLFDIVPMTSGPKSSDAGAVAKAARELERFLDLVGMLASDRSAFLLDERYEGLLTDQELDLSDALQDVVAAARNVAGASGWDQVWSLLRRLGAHPDDIGDPPHHLGSDFTGGGNP